MKKLITFLLFLLAVGQGATAQEVSATAVAECGTSPACSEYGASPACSECGTPPYNAYLF